MNLNIHYLPRDVNRWDVIRALASILHSDEFAPRQRDPNKVDRPVNFLVKVNDSKAGGVGNDGTGTLALPTESLGNRFLLWIKEKPLKIQGKKIKFWRGGHAPHGVASTLDRTPYMNPDLEEEHHNTLRDLQDRFRVDLVQFGVFYRPKYPSTPSEPLSSRAFSVEWERKYTTQGIAWLSFEYDNKHIRIRVR